MDKDNINRVNSFSPTYRYRLQKSQELRQPIMSNTGFDQVNEFRIFDGSKGHNMHPIPGGVTPS